jgi:hypothetical protein
MFFSAKSFRERNNLFIFVAFQSAGRVTLDEGVSPINYGKTRQNSRASYKKDFDHQEKKIDNILLLWSQIYSNVDSS